MKYSIIFWISLIISGAVTHQFTSFFSRSVFLLIGYTYVLTRIWRYVIFRHVPSNVRAKHDDVTIITGASAGIGAETAKQLWARGCKVIWAARDAAKAQAILNDVVVKPGYGKRGYVLQIDLASMKSIENFVNEFKKRETRLNLLILNAGYHGPRRLTADGFEQTIGVNHLGHMYLTYLLLDLMKDSAPGRVIVVASDLHRLTSRVRFEDLMYEKNYGSWMAYNHSKLLNILFAKELGNILKGTQITVHAAHPGTPVLTELIREKPLLSAAVLVKIIFPVVALFFARNTKEASQTPMHCTLSEECGQKTGEYFENCRLATPSQVARDQEAAKRLWNESCKLLKIKNDWA